MRSIFNKLISVLLVALMLVPAIPVFALEAKNENVQDPVSLSGEPTFALKLISETRTTVVLELDLVSGNFVCFDSTITAGKMTCNSITFTSEYKAFANELLDSGYASLRSTNPESGKISVANTGICNPISIATFTYTKNSVFGLAASNAVLSIDSCYTSENGSDVEVTASVVSDLPETHSHIPDGNWIVTKKATCTAEGSESCFCTICNNYAETRSIEKVAHTTYSKITSQPGCTTEGYQKTYCSVCGLLISEGPLPPAGHPVARTNRVKATCTTPGYTEKVCLVCGEILSRIDVPATGHKNTHEETTPATCTQDGLTKVICDDCGTVVSETVIPKTNHSNTHEETTPATCTQDGLTKVICDDCGTVISQTVIPKTNHSNTHEETTPATCTQDGLTKVVCDDCGTVISQTVIPATGHVNKRTVRIEPTCVEDGVEKIICEDCGETISETVLPATGKHEMVTEQKDPTCTESGYIIIRCSVCQNIISEVHPEATGHVWSEWEVIKDATYRSTGIERRTCKICGEFEEQEIPMVIVPPTGIAISKETLSMNYKQTARLYANIVPEEAAYSADIIWSSSDEKVCTVDSNGNVYAAKAGTAVITASTKGGTYKSSCTVTVTYTVLQKVIIIFLFGWIWY